MDAIGELVQRYANLQEVGAQLEANMKDIKGKIIERMEAEKITEYVCPDGTKATITMPVRQTVKVEDVKAVLPEDVFKKILHESIYVCLTVRRVIKKAPVVIFNVGK